MPPTVAAIVVNYNGEKILPACLDSILSQESPFEEVLVVDNASSDHSLELIQANYPEVRVLALKENIGYPAACNRGIQETQSPLVAILNNDIELADDWLTQLLRCVKPPWSFWASRIVFADRTDVVDSAGDAMAVIGSAYKIGHGESAAAHLQSGEVFGPCAAAALYRRDLLHEMSGFDEDFFLVYEDADLAMRARLAGRRCFYVAEAKVRHCVNRSIGTFSHHYVYYGHRNSEILFWKNMPASFLLRYLPERLLFNLACLLVFTYKGRGGSFLRAKWDFLRMLPDVKRKRREVQHLTRISRSQLRSQLDRNWLRYRWKSRTS